MGHSSFNFRISRRTFFSIKALIGSGLLYATKLAPNGHSYNSNLHFSFLDHTLLANCSLATLSLKRTHDDACSDHTHLQDQNNNVTAASDLTTLHI